MIRDRIKYLISHDAFKMHPFLTMSRIARWAAYCAIGRAVSLRLWDQRFTLPPEWYGAGKTVFAFRERQERELAFVTAKLKPGDLFIDVGANIGLYSVAASRVVGPTGTVIACEPSTAAFDYLCRNAAATTNGNIECRRVAVTERAGQAILFEYPDKTRNSLGEGDGSTSSQRVKTTTLDTIVFSECDIKTPVSMIKIDVEGAEALVLRGASRVLREHSPVVIFEINPEAAAALKLEADAAVRLLSEAGYTIFHLGRDMELNPVEANNVTGGNYVALAAQRITMAPPEVNLPVEACRIP